VLLGDLARAGFEVVPEHEDADAIIVNTCAFVEDAKSESLEVRAQLPRCRAGELLCCQCRPALGSAVLRGATGPVLELSCAREGAPAAAGGGRRQAQPRGPAGGLPAAATTTTTTTATATTTATTTTTPCRPSWARRS
jgi:hypothetical protein